MTKIIDFQTNPSIYKHWRVEYDSKIAIVYMDVDENAGLFEGYQLKLNSYDLGVDIELSDIVQRMRFEHPEVKVVIIRSGKDNIFCAGANIRMLAGSTHAHKVNFCKFTNETRNTLEAAAEDSDQNYICAVKGACAGGGYELAMACNYIMLTDDGASTVGLPEVPLLAVLPGTGGLTRITDKRKVRRDLSDVFCSIEEGVKGKKAKDWRLVDELISNATFDQTIKEKAQEFVTQAQTSDKGKGIELKALNRNVMQDAVEHTIVKVKIDRAKMLAYFTIDASNINIPQSMEELHQQGDQSWWLKCARELEDIILYLRLNELAIGTWIFKSLGNAEAIIQSEKQLLDNQKSDWLAHEILMYWKRLLKRIDLTSRSLITLVEPNSCFVGTLAEIVFACDRSYMAEGKFEKTNLLEANLELTEVNFGHYPMSNGLTRLATRFLGEPESVKKAQEQMHKKIRANQAIELGLVTFTFDDIDWEDEIRIFLEERTSFSPDAMTGMEANLRFAGPETMETKIFGRLTAWQNWIFQRPNAVGETGGLQSYGTGRKGKYDNNRV